MRTLLISAYGCEPDRGSEPGVGWELVMQLARHNQLLVITRANNRRVIEEGIPEGLRSRVTFFYYDAPRTIRNLKRGDRGLYPYYFIWQLGILPLARSILRTHKVDFVMHVTFGSIWMPTFMGSLGLPFIWGPIGGAEGVPAEYLRTMSLRQRMLQGFRGVLKVTAELNPSVRQMARQAATILVRTYDTARVIPREYRHKTRIMLETAMGEDVSARPARPIGAPVRLITSGRLVPLKNTATTIQALTFLPSSFNAILEILGDGPERETLERLARELNLHERVHFLGNLPRSEVLEHLSQSDVFLFPSLKECGSWALMEAMAVGLPTVCLRWTGMSIVANDQTSILLDPHDPHTLSQRMASAIERIVEVPGLAASMGAEAAARIASEFTWNAKGAFLERVLDELDYARNGYEAST